MNKSNDQSSTKKSGKRNEDVPEYIDSVAADRLGIYVYVLVHPESKKVFYVGKGQGERVLGHERSAFATTRMPLAERTEKVKIIIGLATKGLRPDFHIVRRNLASSNEAFHIEAALIYAIEVANGQPLVNQNDGMNTSKHGGLSASQVKSFLAPPVNPSLPYPCVMLFNIEKGMRERDDVYESTRQAWTQINGELRAKPDAVAVGLRRGVSLGAFQIHLGSWIEVDPIQGRWAFTGEPLTGELVEKNWDQVTSLAGYWQFGGSIAIELDGNDRFRFLKGHKDKSQWHIL